MRTLSQTKFGIYEKVFDCNGMQLIVSGTNEK